MNGLTIKLISSHLIEEEPEIIGCQAAGGLSITVPMVAKRRTTLRNKAAAAAAAAAAPNHEEMEQTEVDMASRPFLHQPRESKKDKQNTKQQTFLNNILAKAGGKDEFAGISKSAVRRRKRKMRGELKPKMGDLLTSLGQEEDLKDHVGMEVGNAEAQRKVTKVVPADSHEPAQAAAGRKKNEPNIRNQKGAKALSVRETARINSVLTNASFRQNPFGALRDVIKMQQDGSQ